MPPGKTSLPAPWSAFLFELDTLLPGPVDMRCLGAFVLTAVYSLPRFTADLDYLEIMPRAANALVEKLAGHDSFLAKKHGVWMQRVGTGLVDLPIAYDERLEHLDFGFKKLRLFALEAYDLVLSKLTRNSPKDREDVKFFVHRRNLSYALAYQRFVEEMKPWVAKAEWHEQTLEIVWKEYFPQH